jgi:hypothetical protein
MDLEAAWADIRATYWRYRDWFAGIVAVIVIGFLVFEEFIRSITGVEITTTENILFILAYIFVFLQVLADRTEDIRVTNTDALSEIQKEVASTIRFIGGPDSRNSDAPQDRVNDDLRQFIRSNRPEQMDMIEYSSSTVVPLLQAASDARCTVRLLIKKPSSSDPDRQPHRIVQGIDRLYVGNYHEHGLSIRFYEENASLRGRKIDDQLINVGWYTYDKRDPDRGLQLWGSQNTMITVQRKSFEEFSAVDELFSEVFENLWRDGATLKEVYEDNSDEYLIEWAEVGSQEKKEEWIETVSK